MHLDNQVDLGRRSTLSAYPANPPDFTVRQTRATTDEIYTSTPKTMYDYTSLTPVRGTTLRLHPQTPRDVTLSTLLSLTPNSTQPTTSP